MSRFLTTPALVMVLTLASFRILHGQSNSEYTAIRNTNVQIRASLQNSPLAWATETVTITLNKQTGAFEAKLLVDNLYYATTNPDFTGATGENKGKYLTLTGTLPVQDVLENLNNEIDRNVEITANFNDIDFRSTFTFTILAFQTKGFSVMANGMISHRALEINNLAELDDELQIILSFTGY